MRHSGKKLSSFLRFRYFGYFLLRFKWVLGFLLHKSNIKIDKPIFLLGNQGDGLTLMSRVLRKSSHLVSVSGNHRYWTGADEMAIVMEPILGPSWRSSGFLTKDVVTHPLFRSPRSWTYGIDELLPHYRQTKDSIDRSDIKKLKSGIRLALAVNGRSKRFIDKSQIFSIKLGAIQQALDASNPYFLWVTRNPYASIYRAALHMQRDDMYKEASAPFEDKLHFAAQHWLNCTTALENDSMECRNIKRIRVEDFLESPETIAKEICSFLEIPWDLGLLPSADDKIPFFTRYNRRWHPLNTGINDRYLEQITRKDLSIIQSVISDLPKKYGYDAPML